MTHPTIQRLYAARQSDDEAFMRSQFGAMAREIINTPTISPRTSALARDLFKVLYLEVRACNHDGEREAERCTDEAHEIVRKMTRDF